MRFKLPKDYDFTYFTDKEESVFKVNSTKDGSFVMPEEPFAITDKVNFITQSGFKRILIDFSKTKVTRGQIKAISNSITRGQPLPESSRFNWKDGFYSPQQLEEYKAANERKKQAVIPGKNQTAQSRTSKKTGGRTSNTAAGSSYKKGTASYSKGRKTKN